MDCTNDEGEEARYWSAGACLCVVLQPRRVVANEAGYLGSG